jgi:predicted metal-dependent phosphoesterase TrpH
MREYSNSQQASMHEIVVNLHMHTPFSDGHGTHAEIARAAMSAGLDAVIVTDHNVWVNGVQGYYRT